MGRGLVKKLIELNVYFFQPKPLFRQSRFQVRCMGDQQVLGVLLFGDNLDPKSFPAAAFDVHPEAAQMGGMQLQPDLLVAPLMGPDELPAHLV